MQVGNLEGELAQRAPWELAEPWDEVGLLVGRRDREVRRVLIALDATRAVVEQAVEYRFDAVVTHHPLLLKPARRIVPGDRRGEAVLRFAEAGIALFACHTNVDVAPGGLADICADALVLKGAYPLRRSDAGWKKFVGFIPPEVLDEVSAAIYAAGAGRIGEYTECGYRLRGEGTFRPGDAAQPHKGTRGDLELVDEVRVETVVPTSMVPKVVEAFISAHPYEEPAFDVYPLDNVSSSAGAGRVGYLEDGVPPAEIARRLAHILSASGTAEGLAEARVASDSPRIRWAGPPSAEITTVAVLPGSGRDFIDVAAAHADLFVTGDLHHHDAEKATDKGLAVVDVPHGALERWAFFRWCSDLVTVLRSEGVEVEFASSDRLWFGLDAGGARRSAEQGTDAAPEPPGGSFLLRVDGGSRGNPGPAAIGVVLEDPQGVVHEQIGACIGDATNNVAEYQALLTGLEKAKERGIRRLRICSDSELLVKQLRREYRVKDAKLQGLFQRVRELTQEFDRVEIRHVPREENAAADALVNEALDSLEAAGE